ncbi:MAG: PQQ-binding-like beta-propeller repeat protein, partial [Planctomycetes bacterium]|nr:PQQ-binding-like beta-propeller repeat protein [Planctomycetota bacterium]
MSVDSFIAELQERKLISDQLVVKLREKLAEAERPLSVRAVAKFLVQKKHLSQRHANEALDALAAQGEDVDAVPSSRPMSDDVAGDATMVEPVKNTPLPSPPAHPDEDQNDDDEDPDSSSIFAPFLRKIHKRKEVGPAPLPEESDDIQLVPLDEEPPEPVVPPDPSQLSQVKDLAELSASKASLELHPELMSDPLVADVNLVAHNSTLRPESSIKLKSAKAHSKAAREASKRASRSSSRSEQGSLRKQRKPKNEWDSPLILVGGGALILLILCGLAVWWLLNWETGDEKLRLAREARDTGAYTQATKLYEDFLVVHSRHAEASTARVELAMVRLRRDTAPGRYTVAIETAQRELEAIEKEVKFIDAQADLASLLPQIAGGLANSAEQATDSAETEKLIEQANAALGLCANTKYIPKSLRDETQLDEVHQVLARIERRQLSQIDLQQAIHTIEEAMARGDARAAYLAHHQVINTHPELAGDKTLAELVRNISAAEQAAIRYVSEEQAAEMADRPTPWQASLALAHRRTRASADTPGSDGSACVRVDGALYGLDVATGRLLWRRYIGFDTTGWPIRIGTDVLIRDTTHNELLRLDAATGQLRWRQSVGEQFAPPLVVGNRAFLAAESGRLYVLDMATGTRMGYLPFGQPLLVPPAADRLGKRIYLAGDQFNLYAIAISDLTCLGVYHLGHSKGSIQISPTPVLDKLAVLVNDGVETCNFRLMLLDESGVIAAEAAAERMSGLATCPPLVSGRRLILATDRGQMNVYNVSQGDGEKALTLVAKREVTNRQPLTRHMLVEESNIWIGDNQLSKFTISPAGNRLQVESIDNSYEHATFDHPFELFGNTLIHTNRPQGRSGVVVAAMNTEQGRTLWETELAMPPASSPVVDEAVRAVTVANANGYVFRFDETAIKTRVQDEPLPAPSMPAGAPIITTGVDLGAGRAAFCAPGKSNQIVLYDPANGNRTVEWVTLPSPLACAVAPFGEGLLAPLAVGQVFYLNPRDGRSLADPFQPRLQPRTAVEYKPAGVVGSEGRQFVITDGREKIYLVARVDQPRSHFEAVSEGNVGPFPIVSPIFVLGETAIGMTGESNLVRFRLPSLETIGETNIPGVVAWGPYVAGEYLVVATADQRLMAMTAEGDIAWSTPLDGGDLAGPPLAVDGGLVLAFRKGIVERRALADGQPQGRIDVEHPLAAGPVSFLGRIVLTAGDGTLL